MRTGISHVSDDGEAFAVPELIMAAATCAISVSMGKGVAQGVYWAWSCGRAARRAKSTANKERKMIENWFEPFIIKLFSDEKYGLTYCNALTM